MSMMHIHVNGGCYLAGYGPHKPCRTEGGFISYALTYTAVIGETIWQACGLLSMSSWQCCKPLLTLLHRKHDKGPLHLHADITPMLQPE